MEFKKYENKKQTSILPDILKRTDVVPVIILYYTALLNNEYCLLLFKFLNTSSLCCLSDPSDYS